MNIPMFQVDAFTREPLAGNPAAVCPLEAWLPDETLQGIARENNLSETAFFVPEGGSFSLRWFTPTTEVDLCGHATLATAWVLWNCLGETAGTLTFDTGRSGRLPVTRQDERIALHFPEVQTTLCPHPPEALGRGLGADPVEVREKGAAVGHGNFVAVFETESQVRNLRPDFRILEGLGGMSVNPTAPGDDVDFVSRYFAPSFGIDEDPVTGSAHCALIPYWADRLGRRRLHALQVSARGGELFCEQVEGGVIIAGYARLYMDATIHL